MNAPSLLTHGLAGLLGYLIVLSVPDPEPENKDRSFSSESERPVHRLRLRSGSSGRSTRHRLLWNELAHTTMESRHRETLKEDLLNAWADDNPMGLLEFLLERPWTPYAGSQIKAIHKLADEHPDRLLSYALRQGCEQSLLALATTGDPWLAMERLLALGEGNLPGHIISSLFEHAGSIDPEFHLKIDRLGPHRDLAILTANEILYEGNQLDAFLSWLDSMPDQGVRKKMAVQIATLAFSTNARIEWITGLPEAPRKHAIDHLFGDAAWEHFFTSMPDTETRFQWVSEFHRRGWLDPRKHLAGDRLDFFLPQDSMLETGPENSGVEALADAWRKWAQELPDEPDYRDAKLMVMESIISIEPDRWPELLEIHNPQLRDSLLARMTDHLGSEQAWAAIRQIGDPEIRQAAETYQSWLDETGNDPFEEFDGPQPWRAPEAP